ncbi:hypothetical protein FHS49_000981 [Sphingobium boeckii]|uniref:Uncharacterized protein n=1 Tax=Sphingobium boeckii TaxID=1082345 RepID=A0A7W9AG48_9SPHN|nr:hypothetical protein [Sphingobium boeckii]
MTIEPATHSDLNTILACLAAEAAAGEQTVRGNRNLIAQRQQEIEFFGLREAGQVVAFALGKSGAIAIQEIRPDCRAKGDGRILAQLAIDRSLAADTRTGKAVMTECQAVRGRLGAAIAMTTPWLETINGLCKPLLSCAEGAEVIHRKAPWRSFEAVEYATLEWVDWFNNRRLLELLGNVPPAEAEERYTPCWTINPWLRN